jgi:hypothetical protein
MVDGVLTANQTAPSGTGGGPVSRMGAAARSSETPEGRRARRTAYLSEWSEYARTLAQSPRTLRRYAAEQKEQRVRD